MVQIKSVVPRDNYRLEVDLENGNSLTVDFTGRLGTVRFGLLSDPMFFRRAETDGNIVKWENKIEISVAEIFQLAQK
ncbi:hypothetical protein SDC9_81494 [bioreactor metagenome]|uniref:DUF2442 domain-containing protein n=1 Tax=bioreactor metagenome TaxID=1076179 RepID=A0A644ZAI6_9ZZZZ